MKIPSEVIYERDTTKELLVSFRRMNDKTSITVISDCVYSPKRGDCINFNDFNNSLADWEKKKEWIVEKVTFQLPSILYVDCFCTRA